MADIVTDLMNDLVSRIDNVQKAKKHIAKIYEMDDFLNGENQLAYPAVAVIYQGLVAKEDNRNSNKTGLADFAIFDIVVLGASKDLDRSSETKHATTKILDDIRKEIKCSNVQRAGALRPWQFVHELPLVDSDLSDLHMAYVQRWKTTVILT